MDTNQEHRNRGSMLTKGRKKEKQKTRRPRDAFSFTDQTKYFINQMTIQLKSKYNVLDFHKLFKIG
jgi:hypothetical protein